jgi:alpha-1,6-mannosyltransferase
MPHLLDVTMLWSENSGGVRRYLTTKQAWLEANTMWHHTIVAPGAHGHGRLSIRGWPLPFSGGYRVPLSRRKGARAMLSQKPDLIEVGDPYRLAWSALDATRRLHIPLVGFCHSNVVAMADRFGGPYSARMARRYLTRLYDQFDLVLAPSRSMRAKLLDWGIRHVAYQPLGVDTDVFHPAQRDEAWRQELQLPAGSRILVYAGRFGPEKNLNVLAEAVGLLGAPYEFVAIGAGPCPPQGPRTTVLPFTNDRRALARVLASADAFVHAGDQETFGLSALEALACGCPVVACSQGALGELVNEHVGVRVDVLRPSSFAQGIEYLFARDQGDLRQAARQFALQHQWHNAMTHLMQRYQHLLTR